MEGISVKSRSSATRIVASTLGALVGLAGIQHGIFEIFQGHVRPEALLIEAIGPAQRFWQYGTETALTIIPSYLISGILSILLGSLVVLWSVAYIHTKYGPWIFLLLSSLLFLVGGGFAPIILTIIATITATRIGKPLLFWRKILPTGIRDFLARMWPWPIIAAVLSFLVAVVIAIFGYPLLWFFKPETTFGVQLNLAYVMIGLTLLSVMSGFAHDIQDGAMG